MNNAAFLRQVEGVLSPEAGINGPTGKEHSMVADYWSLHLRNRHGTDIALSYQDVQLMMVLAHTVNVESQPANADSMLCIAGYAACMADKLHEPQQEPTQAFEPED